MWFHLVRISAPLSASLCGFHECWCNNYKLIHRNGFSEGCHGTVVAIVSVKIGWPVILWLPQCPLSCSQGQCIPAPCKILAPTGLKMSCCRETVLFEGKSKLFSCPKPLFSPDAPAQAVTFTWVIQSSQGVLTHTFCQPPLKLQSWLSHPECFLSPSSQGLPLQLPQLQEPCPLLCLSHVLCLSSRGNLIYNELPSVILVFSLRKWWLVSVSSCGISNASQWRKGQ